MSWSAEGHQVRNCGNCRYITRDPNNAEDLAHEVLTKAFFGLQRFEGRSSFRHWLQQIKINHCLNYVKKQQGRGDVSIDEPNAEEFEQLKVPATAHQQIETMSKRESIGRVLDSMPETLRIPLILCDMDELSYEEVARSLEISLSAVKMRIKRARAEFRSRYKLHEQERSGAASASPKSSDRDSANHCRFSPGQTNRDPNALRSCPGALR